MSTFFKKTKWFVSYFEKYLLVHFLKIFHVISPFLNFQCSTSHFLKKHKISLVLLIEPFLIRTDCVYSQSWIDSQSCYICNCVKKYCMQIHTKFEIYLIFWCFKTLWMFEQSAILLFCVCFTKWNMGEILAFLA